jgi:hypothetical protein
VSTTTNLALNGAGGVPALPMFRPGDRFDVQYADAAPSNFNITEDAPGIATNVTVTQADTDAQGVANDDQVKWTAPLNKRVDGYLIYMSRSTNGGAFSPFAGVGIVKGKSNTTFNNANVAPTTGTQIDRYIVVPYNLRQVVSATTDPQTLPNPLFPVDFGDCNPAAPTVACSLNNPPVNFRPAPDSAIALTNWAAVAGTATPISITSNKADTGALNAGIYGAGDSFQFTFINAPIAASAGASITLQDSDGTQGTFTNGQNATFVVGGTGSNNLTVNITGAPSSVVLGSGGDNLLQFANVVSVLSESGVTNSSGEWNLPESGRGRIDVQRTRVLGASAAPPNGNDGLLPDEIRAAVNDNFVSDPPGDLVVANFNATVNNDANDPNFAVDPTAKTVRIKPGTAAEGCSPCQAVGNLQNGDTVIVSNSKGVQIGTGVYNEGTGTTINTPGIDFGQLIYINYRRHINPANTIEQHWSQTNAVLIAADTPTVVSVSGKSNNNPSNTNQLHVTWTDNNLPDNASPCKGITQVGPASNYQLFDAANNVLIATGQTVTPGTYNCTTVAATGGTTHDFVVTFNAQIPIGPSYNLRVAPSTVQDPNNKPNLVIVFPIFGLGFQGGNVNMTVDGASAGLTSFIGGNDPDDPFSNNGTFEQSSPTNQPSFNGTATTVDGNIASVVYCVDDPLCLGPGTPANLSGPLNNRAWSFTVTPALSEGYHQLTVMATDTVGSTFSDVFDFNVNAVAPSVVSITTIPGNGNINSPDFLVTFSEAVDCINGSDTTVGARFAFSDSSTPVSSFANGIRTEQVSAKVCGVTGPGIRNGEDYGPLTYTQPPSGSGIRAADDNTLVGGFSVVSHDIGAPTYAATTAATNPSTVTVHLQDAGDAGANSPENINCTQITQSTFTVTVNGTPDPVTAATCTGGFNSTITLTVAAPFVAGNTIVVTVSPNTVSNQDPGSQHFLTGSKQVTAT